MRRTWTITELAERAAEILAAGRPGGSDRPGAAERAPATAAGPSKANGRIRDRPNARLIRWYTTIGLVDPPLSRRGRIALYGERHLLQLVAIKRRQAVGRTIAEIQVELAGATEGTLRTIARLPAARPAPPAPVRRSAGSPRPAPAAPAAPEPAAEAPRSRGRFWTAPTTAETTEPAGDSRGAADSTPSPVCGLRLAPGTSLVLDASPGEDLSPEALIAIGRAAVPLLAELRARGLIPDPNAVLPAPSTEPPGRST